MKRLTKIILSIPIYIFCFLALGDVLSGGEPLIDELVVLALGAVWTAYLIKPFKPPKFFLAFLFFLVNAVLHNVISHLLKTEEAVFFILALLSFVISVILFFVFMAKKIKNVLFNSKYLNI